MPPSPAERAAERWAFLEQYDWRHLGQGAFSFLWSRPTSSNVASRGYALSGGESLALLPGAFAVGGMQDFELRFVPDDALGLHLSRYHLESGLRVGALEAMVRVGVTTLHVSYGDGFSVGMFSPRVGAGAWLWLGAARLGVSAFSEYCWRWLGDESAFVQGLSLELALARPKY